MSIQFVCEKCHIECTVPEEFAGDKIPCPNCGINLKVPKRSLSQSELDQAARARQARQSDELSLAPLDDELSLAPLDDEPATSSASSKPADPIPEEEPDEYGIKGESKPVAKNAKPAAKSAKSAANHADDDLLGPSSGTLDLSDIEDTPSDPFANSDAAPAYLAPAKKTKGKSFDLKSLNGQFGIRGIVALIVLVVMLICAIMIFSNGHWFGAMVSIAAGLFTATAILIKKRPEIISAIQEMDWATVMVPCGILIGLIALTDYYIRENGLRELRTTEFWVFQSILAGLLFAVFSINFIWTLPRRMGCDMSYAKWLVPIYIAGQIAGVGLSDKEVSEWGGDSDGKPTGYVAQYKYNDYKRPLKIISKSEPVIILGENPVEFYEVDIEGDEDLQVMIPVGEHERYSLPCVIVGPAGSNLACGASISPDYLDEMLPYARAGFVVISYDIAGDLPKGEDSTMNEALRAYEKFKSIGAGIGNALLAKSYVNHLPAVDRNCIYIAGHSSAGTLALLYSQHQTNIDGCIAYAPVCDVEAHLEGMESVYGDSLDYFACKSSPMTHAKHLECPTLLFYAKDDDVINTEEIESFKTLIEPTCKNVSIQTVPNGGHYDAMIEHGIPAGIEWLKSIGAKPFDYAAAPPRPVNPPDGPVDPVVGPVDPVVGPVDPVVGPVDPIVGPIDPIVDPIVGPVDPIVGPVDPIVGPGDPIEPGGSGSFGGPTVETIDDYVTQTYLDRLRDDGAQLRGSGLLWLPAARRPTIGTRWAIGIQWSGKGDPPPITTVDQLTQSTNPIGSLILNSLKTKSMTGEFGIWPNYGNDEIRQAPMLGFGTLPELTESARNHKVDFVMVFTLDMKKIGNRTDGTVRIRLIDPTEKLPMWSSSEMNARKMQIDAASGGKLIGEFVEKVDDQIEKNYLPAQMPSLTPEMAASRIGSFNWKGKTRDEALSQLVEIQYYRVHGLINDVQARQVLESAVDGAFADAFLADAATRIEAITRRMKIGPQG